MSLKPDYVSNVLSLGVCISVCVSLNPLKTPILDFDDFVFQTLVNQI